MNYMLLYVPQKPILRQQLISRYIRFQYSGHGMVNVVYKYAMMLCAMAHAAVDSRLVAAHSRTISGRRYISAGAKFSVLPQHTGVFAHWQGSIWNYVNLHIIIKLILGGAVGMLALIRLQATPALLGAVAPGRPETSLYASCETKTCSMGSQFRFTIYNILTS
eukprot:2343277-Pleurochrysis_carterae.AAC.1